MVYHEARRVRDKTFNYLVYNKRDGDKWKKKSKFIGEGYISKSEVGRLKRDFELELRISRDCDFLTRDQVLEIERLRGLYVNGVGRLSREEFEKFEKSFATELTYNSNAIEGNSMSLEETSIVINEGLAPEGKTLREVYEAKNHAKALDFVKGYRGDVNELFILKVHSLILEGISGRFSGRYRENPVRVVGSDFKFPSSDKVAQLVKNLIYWYKENKKRVHAFELATVFSMKFVSIHPFTDGNGRVSRLLMNFILEKNGYPRVNVYMKHRQKYLRAVREANDEDYLRVLGFLVETLGENLDSFGLE